MVGQKELYESEGAGVDESSSVDDMPAVQSTSADIDGSSINAMGSFEVFSGKVFDLRRADFSDAIGSKGAIGGISGQRDYEHLCLKDKKYESPLQRLMRLRIEAKELEAELQALVSQRGPNVLVEQRASGKVLLEASSALRTHLQSIAADAIYEPFLSPEVELGALQQRQVSLSAQLTDLVGGGGSGCNGKQGEGAAAAALKRDGPKTGDGSDSGYSTYELYTLPSLQANTESWQQAALEKRIAALEKIVGVNTATAAIGGSGSGSLTSAVVALRENIRLLDPTMLASQAHLLQSVLQSLKEIEKSEGRGSLGSATSDILDRMNAWQEALALLPIVIQRLKTLKQVHQAAVEQVNSISDLNKQHSQLSAIVEGQKKQLAAFEGSLQANLQAMEEKLRKGVQSS